MRSPRPFPVYPPGLPPHVLEARHDHHEEVTGSLLEAVGDLDHRVSALEVQPRLVGALERLHLPWGRIAWMVILCVLAITGNVAPETVKRLLIAAVERH